MDQLCITEADVTTGTSQRSSEQGLCRIWARYGRCPGCDVNDCGYDHSPHLAQNIGEANDDGDLDRKAGNNDHFSEKDIDSTASSELDTLGEFKVQYRAKKNKNRPQREGTSVGDKKDVGVACAWQTTQQRLARANLPLPLRNRYIVLDDDYNKTENGVNVIDKVEDDALNAGGNMLSTRLKTTTSYRQKAHS